MHSLSIINLITSVGAVQKLRQNQFHFLLHNKVLNMWKMHQFIQGTCSNNSFVTKHCILIR